MNYGEQWSQEMKQEITNHLKRSSRIAKEFDEKLDRQAKKKYPKDSIGQCMWKVGGQQALIEWLLSKGDSGMLDTIENFLIFKEK